MSRRYICHCCAKSRAAAKQVAIAATTAAGLDIVGEGAPGGGGGAVAEGSGGAAQAGGGEEDPAYTFMGYEQGARTGLPHGYGEQFPAFLTYRAGVDLQLVDLMRPLCDKGVRCQSTPSLRAPSPHSTP